MASSITLAEMMARARTAAQMDGDQGEEFYPDTDLVLDLNQGIRELYDRLVLARGEEYYITGTNTAIVAGTFEYALPADFYRSCEVTIADGAVWAGPVLTSAANHHPIGRFQTSEISDMLRRSANGECSDHRCLRYMLRRTTIALQPTPRGSAWVMIHHYIPCATLVDAGDSFDGINGWEEVAILYAAIKMLIKEGTLDVADRLEGERARILVRVDALASTRDQGLVATRRDTRRDGYGARNRVPPWGPWNGPL